jgi:hypothetical protein
MLVDDDVVIRVERLTASAAWNSVWRRSPEGA